MQDPSSPSTPSSPWLVLHSRRSSLVLEHHGDEAPLWRYWGPRLADAALPATPLRQTRPVSSFAPDQDFPFTVAPSFGSGWFGQSALLAHRDGRHFAQRWATCEAHWLRPTQALRLDLHDPVAQLRLAITLDLDAATDVLSVRSALHNLGTDVLDVQWLAAGTLLLPPQAEAVHSYAGQHLQEFLAQRDLLGRSLWRRESRRGRTSHDCHPSAVVTLPGTDHQHGVAYGAHLAWSGNHQQSIEWLHDGLYQWQLGEWLAPGEGRLAPGAVLQTPELLAACADDGLDGLSARFHTTLRGRMTWPGGAMRPRPVHLNTWEALYFDHKLDDLKALADAAAAVGVERYVLDDGWFHGRHHDRAALGDWWPDAGKYPQGLASLVDHVHGLGMGFGLWFEPEMVNPDSDLYRAHPDWALHVDGLPRVTARNQLVLDIARPEVSDYLFEKIDAVLRSVRVDYIKWDHNRDLIAAGRDGQPVYRAQALAAWALMDRVRQAHPEVEIESCSGGGGRIDFGVLRHTHRVWTSDCIDALSRVDIQRGFLQFFPPEIMGAHVGTAPAHTTGRSQSMAFRAAVALPGHLGVELDVRQLDDAARQTLAGWISLYKQWRHRLHQGRVWRGDAGDGVVWQAHGDAAADELLLLVYRLQPSTRRAAPTLPLPMLARNADYQVVQVSPPGEERTHELWATDPLHEALRTGDGVRMAGGWLVAAGLPAPRMQAESAWMLHLRRVHRQPGAAAA
ncbi:alpha-galactosidase [Rubrivivax albus]|uniref:Alpha-galactosidase n=1 Tax=Rubrivivax albus TaxID=2499835 RepID=A0A3S2TK69_9BURK|nr:alpha-galactosidase [Rubrivivax albus]RVT49420.1 alpha-galactosidase [Rubrivivax albus]